MTLQKITILGSTGSIGVNTLDVIRRHPQRYSVVALCAHKQIDRLFDQCLEFKPCFAVVRDARLAADLNSRLAEVASSTIVEYGPDALVRMAELPEVDTVMAAIVGAAGLPVHAGRCVRRQAGSVGKQRSLGHGWPGFYGCCVPKRRKFAADR